MNGSESVKQPGGLDFIIAVADAAARKAMKVVASAAASADEDPVCSAGMPDYLPGAGRAAGFGGSRLI
jgi:hypothetical protein